MEIIIASIIAFATTNLDDIFILTLFFSNSGYTTKNVILGQYLGISTLIAISFVGSFIGLIIDPKYIGLLGLIPIYMGIKSAFNLMSQIVPHGD
jgi:cadmium resistance protein CadD (predicted permease)